MFERDTNVTFRDETKDKYGVVTGETDTVKRLRVEIGTQTVRNDAGDLITADIMVLIPRAVGYIPTHETLVVVDGKERSIMRIDTLKDATLRGYRVWLQ